MSFDLTCPHCKGSFRPLAEQAGKTAACPQCGKEVRIPAAELRKPPTVEAADPRWKTPATIWYVQAEDGRQYGPVTGDQLHGWYEQGRITADCQLLRKGAVQWQWATDLYPDLQEAAVPDTPTLPSYPRPAAPRAAPAQSVSQITPLDPSDFPTAGAGLKALGPMIRQLPPGYEEPRYHNLEALADRRKYAPHMVPQIKRRPLHFMLVIIAIMNFVVGTLRGAFYSFVFVTNIIAVAALGDAGNRQTTAVSVGLLLSFVLLALSITLMAGGIGLLQQREWGRSWTFTATLIDLLFQLTGVCVTMLLGADVAGVGRWFWMLLFLLLLPSILYDAFAAATLTVPSVVEYLEE